MLINAPSTFCAGVPDQMLMHWHMENGEWEHEPFPLHTQ